MSKSEQWTKVKMSVVSQIVGRPCRAQSTGVGKYFGVALPQVTLWILFFPPSAPPECHFGVGWIPPRWQYQNVIKKAQR